MSSPRLGENTTHSPPIDWIELLGIAPGPLGKVATQIRETNDYYVYIMWKMYDERPIPFYVGKGHQQRLIKHEMASEADSNRYKTNVIKKHKRMGEEPGYSIVDFFSNEAEALRLEKDLIELIGRADLDVGPLTNKTDGGDGSLGHLAPKGGDSASARPVVADGISYPCLGDAAEAHRVEGGTIAARIRNGWPGYYYVDEGQRPAREGNLGRYRRRVVVKGEEFDSLSAAARALKMDPRMIHKRISYGWLGYYYPDEGQLPKRTIWGSRKDKVPVIVHGRRYETMAQACRETGESRSKIYKRCLSTNYPDYYRKDGQKEEKLTPPRYPEHILVRNERFSSMGEAARAHGITRGAVEGRCASSNFPAWRYADREKGQMKDKNTPFSSKPIRVEVEGIVYESFSSAARAHGVDINTLKQRCKSLSFPDWICDRIEKKQSKDGKRGLIAIVIEGRRFRSINRASKELHIPRAQIKKRINSSKWRDWKEGS